MSEINFKSKIEKEIYSISDNEQFCRRIEIYSFDSGIIQIISELFTNICDDKNNKNKNNIMKYFDIETQPSISIKDYIARLYNFSNPNQSTIIASLIYIDRFCHKNDFKITQKNIYKLILTSLIVAAKYNEDSTYSMTIFSKIGGITMTELNNLELKFLFMIHFDLYIDKELYYNYYNNLMDLNFETEETEEIEENEESNN